MELNLAAQLLLIGLDEQGEPHPAAAALDYGLAGAALIDLARLGRVAVAAGSVTVTGRAPTGDPTLDHALRALPDDGLGNEEAINRLREGLRQATVEPLVAGGVLRREKHRLLWVIPDERFPAAGGVQAALRDRLAGALDGEAVLDTSTAALLSLVRSTGLEEAAFPGRPKPAVRARIEACTSGTQWADGGTRAAVDEVQAALLAVLTVVFLAG
ncbi:MAG TPA: GPP34 family phosphoprotein [Actinoplanes sp.]|nr:GPP34 family phosphoprotein [Actinoplanes sp.]